MASLCGGMPKKRRLEEVSEEVEVDPLPENEGADEVEKESPAQPPAKQVYSIEVDEDDGNLNAIGGASLLLGEGVGGDTVQQARAFKAVPGWVQAAQKISSDNTSPVELLPLQLWLLDNLRHMGLKRCFPVQAEVIPKILASGGQQDFCVCAPTGSGKTLAYSVPIISALSDRVVPRLRALILLPTRDLALQVHRVFVQASQGSGLKAALALGQQSFAEEQAALVGADILVATPGRLVDHLASPLFSLEHLRFLVLDEADRLLMQAYQEWLPAVLKGAYVEQAEAVAKEDIISLRLNDTLRLNARTIRSSRPTRLFVPTDAAPLQKLLFSATLTQNPQKLASLKLHNPVFFSYSAEKSASVAASRPGPGEDEVRFTLPPTLKEHMLICSTADKPVALYHLVTSLLPTLAPGLALCFTSSVDSAHRLYILLSALGMGNSVGEFSGSLHAAKRAELLSDLSRGNVKLLICSDVMARGMDVPAVAAVINYDVPQHFKTYVHRVGRTARAGAPGAAFSLLRRDQVFHFKIMLGTKADKRKIKELAAPKLDAYSAAFRKALVHLKATLEKEKYKSKVTTADANSEALLETLRAQALMNFLKR